MAAPHILEQHRRQERAAPAAARPRTGSSPARSSCRRCLARCDTSSARRSAWLVRRMTSWLAAGLPLSRTATVRDMSDSESVSRLSAVPTAPSCGGSGARQGGKCAISPTTRGNDFMLCVRSGSNRRGVASAAIGQQGRGRTAEDRTGASPRTCTCATRRPCSAESCCLRRVSCCMRSTTSCRRVESCWSLRLARRLATPSTSSADARKELLAVGRGCGASWRGAGVATVAAVSREVSGCASNTG